MRYLGKFSHPCNLLVYTFLEGIYLKIGARVFGQDYASPIGAFRADINKQILTNKSSSVGSL